MTSFLLDMSGDIYFDTTGKMVEISGEQEVKQRIINLFNTQRGSEIFMEDYGFDKVTAFRETMTNKSITFKTCVIEALKPQNLFGINGISNIRTELASEDTNLIGKIYFTVSIGKEIVNVAFKVNQT